MENGKHIKDGRKSVMCLPLFIYIYAASHRKKKVQKSKKLFSIVGEIKQGVGYNKERKNLWRKDNIKDARNT